MKGDECACHVTCELDRKLMILKQLLFELGRVYFEPIR